MRLLFKIPFTKVGVFLRSSSPDSPVSLERVTLKGLRRRLKQCGGREVGPVVVYARHKERGGARG